MAIGRNGNRGTHVPSIIIVHHTDDYNHAQDLPHGIYDPNFRSVINRSIDYWESNPQHIGPHYVIDRDGTVVKLCHETRVANHLGSGVWDSSNPGTGNSITIGIEVVHTSNQRTPHGPPTYTEEFNPEQYTSLVELLRDLINAFNIPDYNIIGHSDMATDGGTIPVTIVGRKSGDPGRQFNWALLEAEGLGLRRDPDAIDMNIAYGGFFAAHPDHSIRANEPGVTPPIVNELKADLIRIGYSVTNNDIYDRSVSRAIMVFCEHFSSLDGQNTVSLDTAITIKRIVAFLHGVKP